MNTGGEDFKGGDIHLNVYIFMDINGLRLLTAELPQL